MGILVFEFMCGYVPFGDDLEDPFAIYKIVMKGKLSFPDYFLDLENKEARNFIKLLLSRIPEARLNGNYTTLKAHKWYEGFDWDQLID